MGRKRVFCTAAAAAGALALATSASADPWAGGREVVTPLEAQLVEIVGEVAERPVQVHCNAAAEWSALATRSGFAARSVWGYVTFTPTASGWAPGDEAELAEPACRHAEAFWAGGSASKPARTCRVGTKIERRPGRRPRRVPVVRLCPGYVEGRLFALQTIAHEAVHLSGVEDEAVAECYGVQLLAFVAWKLGASNELARRMAADYWREYYLVRRPGTPYFDEGCRDGGVLDLAPDRSGWPAPAAIAATRS